MHLESLGIDGVRVVRFPRHEDERGYFQRTFDRAAFLAAGLDDCSLECSLSWNAHERTLRGLHFQRMPYAETKLVRCLAGRIFDVAVDIRPGSVTFGRWIGVELSAQNGLAFYISRGFAHGFLTLDAGTLVQYQMAQPFVPEAGSGLKWDDPDIGIAWPAEPAIVGERDRTWGSLAAFAAETSG